MENTYINYGTDQIDLQQLLNSISNNVNDYVNSQSWSNKRKLKFMEAYSDIISKGIIGADNSSGQWALNLNQNIDLENKSKMDLSMYHEAAYFILELMQGITPQNKKEEEEKKDLPVYDYNTHIGGINDYVKRTLYGGQEWVIGGDRDNWNYLDERGENGLRGIKVRANKLANILDGYSKTIEEGKYNFEGSAFSDLNDLKNRLSTASLKLRAGIMDLDTKDALNLIGLNWKDYFNDGSGDIAGTDTNGNEITYAQLAEQNLAAAAAAAKEEAAKKAVAAKQNAGVLDITSGINPQEARTRAKEYAEWLGSTHGVGQQGFNKINARVLELIEGAYTKQLTGADKKELGNLLYYITTNNPNYLNYNLTPEEEVELQVHENMKGRRLQDFRRLPWNTSDGRNTYIDKSGNLYFLKPRNQKLLLQKLFTRSAAYNNYKNNFLINTSSGKDLRRAKIDQRVVGDDFKTEDYLRMGAIAQDIAGTVAAFAPVYGTAASGILGLTSLGTNMAADIADESVSGLDVAKNAAINLGLGVVGLVPGLGGAAKSGKWLTQIAKWVPRILTLAQAGNIAINDDVKNSLAKAADTSKWNTITNHDLKNISYALSTVAGLSRGARGIYNERKFGPAFKGSSKTELKITTESGKKVTVTNEQLKELNKIGRKSGNDAANKYLNEKIIGDASGTEKVNVTFKTGKASRLTSPTVKAETITSSTSIPHRTQAYRRALSIQNQRAKSGKGIYKFAPRFLNTDYEIYQKAYNISTPLIGLIDKIKLAWNPITKGKFKETNSNASTPSTGSTAKQNVTKRETPLTEAEANTLKNNVKSWRQEHKDILNINKNKGRSYEWGKNDVGTNPERLKSEIKLGDKELKFEINSDGELIINGEKTSINGFGNSGKREVRRKIREVVQKTTKEQKLKRNTKEFEKLVSELRKLKSAGFLQQGGQINNFDLDKTILEFLSKLK